MLNFHNHERAECGMPRLCIDPKLQRAARAHAKDMVDRDYFSHDTKGARESFSERLTRFGYNWSTCAENIVRGSGSAGSASNMFDTWMNSLGHRANIVNDSYRQIGIAAYTGDWKGTPNTSMWVSDFATPR